MDENKNITSEQLELLMRREQQYKDINPLETIKNKGLNVGDVIIPIDQGNTVGVEAYKAIYAGFDLEGYFWLLMFQRYFTNLWTIGNATNQEQTAFKMALATMFWFGTCGLYRDKDNKLISYGLTATEVDENQEIENGYLWINNQTFMGLGKITQTQKLGGKQCVYGKFNLNGLPMIILVYGLIKKMVKMDKAFYTNLTWNAKKLIYTQKNNSSSQIVQEMSALLDVDNPLVIEKSTDIGADTPNKFRELEQPQGNLELMKQIREYFGFMFRLIGGYENSVSKSERNVTNEFAKDEIMVKCQLEEIQFELEKLVFKMNERWGTTFTLESKIQKWMAESKDEPLEENEKKSKEVEDVL